MILSSKGIILKVFPYSNTSVICNVFTDDHGKLTFIAKGIRKPKNPLVSILQPFNLVEFQYYYKKTRGIQLVKEADILIGFDKLRDNLITITIASNLLNIINRTFEEGYQHPIVFRLIYKILNKLSSNILSNKITFIFFLFHLSKQLGFMPNINQCYHCSKVFTDFAVFNINLKSLLCGLCQQKYDIESNINIYKDSISFLNLIDKTNIDKIINIETNNLILSNTYTFLMTFMRSNISYINNLKGLTEIDKIYYEE